MCGIAGIVRFDEQPIQRHRIDAMVAHMRHRGPDGQGVKSIGPCALAHTRLSIIDLTGGAQPMTDGNLTVVFNGEIYNHRALRKQLEAEGARFNTDHSDTEVLLHGYRRWGRNLPKHLQGMFAFAIYDDADRSLYLARDRAGKKPLYVARQGQRLYFASLISTLIAGGVAAKLRRDALLTFLRLGYTFNASLLEGVDELPPAHDMHVTPGGRVDVKRYWRPEPRDAPLRDTIEQAVASRLESDVPLGCFLSGGIDSSIVAALAQKQLAERGQRLRTFSVKMPAAAYDESDVAAAVAEHIGSDHTQLSAAPSASIIDDLRNLIAITGEPTADSSILPTHLLSRATRAHVKVALSGDGGDELFAGYDRYRAMGMLRRHGWWLSRMPAAFFDSADPKSWSSRARRLIDAAQFTEPPRQYQSMIHLFTDRQIARLIEWDAPLSRPVAPVPDWPQADTPIDAARLWDMAHYLPMDLLRKVDRASMAVALEVRCPLLDTAVIEVAAGLNASQLMPRGKPKALLRQLAAELVPPFVSTLPKRGFAIPVGQWFRQELRSTLHDHLTAGGLDWIGFDRRFINRLYDEHVQYRADHTHRLFALLEIALWVDWLKGR